MLHLIPSPDVPSVTPLCVDGLEFDRPVITRGLKPVAATALDRSRAVSRRFQKYADALQNKYQARQEILRKARELMVFRADAKWKIAVWWDENDRPLKLYYFDDSIEGLSDDEIVGKLTIREVEKMFPENFTTRFKILLDAAWRGQIPGATELMLQRRVCAGIISEQQALLVRLVKVHLKLCRRRTAIQKWYKRQLDLLEQQHEADLEYLRGRRSEIRKEISRLMRL